MILNFLQLWLQYVHLSLNIDWLSLALYEVFALVISDYEARLSKADKEERELMNPAIERATNALKFVAQHVKNEDNFNSYADDWKYVAMVLDRILLWMFTIACVVGK